MSKNIRKRKEDRKIIDSTIKYENYAKLDSKCPCCNGKFEASQMTNEHIVPLSKGGSNDPSNLTLLCPECNDAKGDLVAHPDWYKYATKSVKKDINNALTDYLKNYAWLDSHNFLPFDLMPLDYDMILPNCNGVAKKQRVWVKKVTNNGFDTDNLERIYEFSETYNTKHKIDCHGDDLRKIIDERLRDGAMYYIEGTDGNIGALFTLEFSKTLDLSDVKEPHYVLYMHNPMFRYDNYSTASLCMGFVNLVQDSVMSEFVKNNLSLCPYSMDVFDSSPKLARFMQSMSYSGLMAGEDFECNDGSTGMHYHVILHNIKGMNGNKMSYKDLDLIASGPSGERQKVDNYIERLIYNETQQKQFDYESKKNHEKKRKVKSKKKYESGEDAVRKVSKKGSRIKEFKRYDEYDDNFDKY